MERSGNEDRGQDGEAGDPPSRSAQALARARAVLESRRERDAIRLRHPAFRNDDAQRLMREASEIAIAAGLAMDGVARNPPPPSQPEPVAPSRPVVSLSAAALAEPLPPEPGIRPVPPAAPPVALAEPPLLPPRREGRAPRDMPRRPIERLVSGLARLDLLRVGLAAMLVTLAGGAVYGSLPAVQPEEAAPAVAERPPPVAEPEPPVAASPPPVLELRPVRVKTIRIPVPPPPDAVPADAGPTGLSLRGGVPGFVQVVPGAPAEACAILVAAGWTTDGWGTSPIGAKGECLAERRYGASGETSSFAVLRGGHTLAELRIKLNLGDAAWAAEAARDAGRLVATLFEAWRWQGGAALEERIAALQPFEDVVDGTAVRFAREYGEVDRFNLLLRFPQPLRTPEAGAAEAQAAALATLSAIVAAHVGGGEVLAEPGDTEAAGR